MKTKKTRKGFTLIELVMVLAIMGILIAIIIPSWSYFVRRSRERTANAKAKVIFNAAQTEVTRVNMKERPDLNVANDPAADSVKRANAKNALYIGDGDFYFYWDGKNGAEVDKDGNDIGSDSKSNISFANGINNINNNGEGVYKIYVNNYNVQSVVYSDLAKGRYKGTYPRMMDDLPDAVRSSVRSNAVQSIDLKSIV